MTSCEAKHLASRKRLMHAEDDVSQSIKRRLIDNFDMLSLDQNTPKSALTNSDYMDTSSKDVEFIPDMDSFLEDELEIPELVVKPLLKEIFNSGSQNRKKFSYDRVTERNRQTEFFHDWPIIKWYNPIWVLWRITHNYMNQSTPKRKKTYVSPQIVEIDADGDDMLSDSWDGDGVGDQVIDEDCDYYNYGDEYVSPKNSAKVSNFVFSDSESDRMDADPFSSPGSPLKNSSPLNNFSSVGESNYGSYYGSADGRKVLVPSYFDTAKDDLEMDDWSE